MTLTAENLMTAQEMSAEHMSQIQIFYYAGRQGELHVVRDLTKDADKQILWSLHSTKDDYENAHAEAIAAQQLHQAQVITDTINLFMSEGW
jgi:glucose/arabinose dehydrogenase